MKNQRVFRRFNTYGIYVIVLVTASVISYTVCSL